MDVQQIIRRYASSPQTAAFLKTLADPSVARLFLQGLMASAAPLFFSGVASRLSEKLRSGKQEGADAASPVFVFILNDADEAGYFYHDLTQLLGTSHVLFFPSGYRRAVKYGQRDAANEILRTEVLARLASQPAREEAPLYVVTCPEALAELVVSKQVIDERRLELGVGQVYDIVELERTLRELGFRETDYVYEPGQFAVRGSIVDVFSYSCELPFRIDFFGDEVDSIRTFTLEDQLSKEQRRQVTIVPELSATAAAYVPFLQLLPSTALLVMKDFTFVHGRMSQIYEEGFSRQALAEQMEGATEQEQQEIARRMQKESTLCRPTLFTESVARMRRIEMGHRPTGTPAAVLHFNLTPQPLFHKNFDLLRQTFEDYQLKGYELFVLADSLKQQERLREILNPQEDRSQTVTFTPVDKTLHEGFVDNEMGLCLFTDHQIFDRFHKYSLKSDGARAGKMALTMKELQEMEPGDFLVHVDFGIGKFGGLVRVPAGDSYREVIRIIYQRGDKVDVSIHALYKISKYRRSDTGEPPRLSTLGTGAWERMKERTKKKIKDIARDLIKLYAKRRHEKGYAFSADSYLQHELEASFLYEDTPDQLRTTQEVKADMEQERPMDRLVCGDVGFGKTEVAVRAAFKAACDSKQVAVLVPTTVLAFQHYKTFSSRLKGMPVRVDYLSRARTAKQTKEVLADLEAGKIDILVGTHKLISKTVKWKDLGLLIIDEEQKFGVSVKEKLRTLKTNVDTLTMSATPIPRTLQFSLMGARDMSVMRTPPPNRYPIQTDVSTFGSEVVADAINFEMSRNGQVFFVNDRISNLPGIAQLIQRQVPDCRIAIGHGQMAPDELEQIIMGFINHEYDVLLSTTIVENGIDIPNANTIIINDAHRFGLSDLHQMRGRVGRSNRKAFCYLLAPPKSALTPEARRRLEALENFSDQGSGFALAMQDLDIRGAGNLLGAEQSGFMEDLGYETYQKILSQAVTELKNEEFQDLYAEELEQGRELTGDAFVDDCAVGSDLEMYFPDTYVPGARERMSLYRELDNITEDSDLEAYRQRLVDRFGPVPHEGEELMQVVVLRRLGKRLGCEKVTLNKGQMSMQFVSNTESVYYRSAVFDRVLSYIAAHPRRCNLKEIKGRRLMLVSQVPTVEEAVSVLRQLEGRQPVTS